MVCSDVGPVVDQGSAVIDVMTIDAGVMDVGVTDVARPDVPRRDVPAEDVVATCDPAALALDRTCTNDSQCRAGIFTINCCGTARAIGYNVVSRSAFELLRSGCDQLYGGVRMCRCPTLPTELDDGTRSTDHGRIMASCIAGRCASHLRP